MSSLASKIIAVVTVFLVVGLLMYPKIKPLLGEENASSSTAGNNAPLKVEAFEVKPDTVNDIIYTTGTLIANEDIELRSEVSGLITDIYLQEGRPVKKGDLLIKINDSELQAQLKRAQYRLELAAERESRQKKLLEKGGISQEDYDATLNEVNVLRSEVALIQAQIDKTEIRAPFDGQIGLKYVSDGSYISPATRIASLQSIDPIKIDFSIPERYAGKVQEGDRIRFSVQGTDEEFTGEIYAIEPKIESETRTLQIRARSENKQRKLMPGAFADLELTLETITDAKMIPTIALVPELQGQKVYIYRDGQVEQQSVQTGLRTESSVQIIEGVEFGDTILTTGLLQVRPGMPVQLQQVQ
ncbi:efflux RND transporter periplasmic adaptor subunit [Halalkalibaculum sp. DA3122]|uniref:efflux RND transporter periplasmic adaptor subunit n=1 Tax=unclassified Halalkalibaculum TaxID=2964617 RepID=UPI0037549AEF